MGNMSVAGKLVGGFPEPVAEFVKSENISIVRDLHALISRFYKADCSKYDMDHKLRIIDIYNHLPSFME